MDRGSGTPGLAGNVTNEKMSQLPALSPIFPKEEKECSPCFLEGELSIVMHYFLFIIYFIVENCNFKKF